MVCYRGVVPQAHGIAANTTSDGEYAYNAAPAVQGLTVMANGHVLEAHEYAVCDMSGDAMPSWEVKKKQCIDLV